MSPLLEAGHGSAFKDLVLCTLVYPWTLIGNIGGCDY